MLLIKKMRNNKQGKQNVTKRSTLKKPKLKNCVVLLKRMKWVKSKKLVKSNEYAKKEIDIQFSKSLGSSANNSKNFRQKPQTSFSKLKQTKISPSITENINTIKNSTENDSLKRSLTMLRSETLIRSKRTPKPNRKYLDENLITSFSKKSILKNNESIISDTEIDIRFSSESEVDSDILQESDETSGEESYEFKYKSNKHIAEKQIDFKNDNDEFKSEKNSSLTATATKKPVILNKFTNDRNSTNQSNKLVPISSGEKLNRKRIFNEVSPQQEQKSKKVINLDVFDDNNADETDIEEFVKELTNQNQIKILKNLSSSAIKKKSIVESVTDKRMQVLKKPELNTSTTQPIRTQDLSLQDSHKQTLENSNDSIKCLGNNSIKKNGQNDDPLKKSENLNLEDFEKMPTFTIVNINDIIGKKGDLLHDKKESKKNENDEQYEAATKSKSISPKRIVQNKRKQTSNVQLSENLFKSKEAILTSQVNSKNKKTEVKSSAKQDQVNANNTKHLKSISKTRQETNKISHKEPPRILNSFVAKKASSGTNFNSKHNTNVFEIETKYTDLNARNKFMGDNKNLFLKQSNESKINNFEGLKRKLPSEKVIIQRQGNKIIKKITCFETWYVINLPPETFEKENLVRNTIEIPLIDLANNSKTVSLPSDKWTCKVSLQRCQVSLTEKERYTGEIYDEYIDPNELHKYRPTNVMFRRQAIHPTPKVPYDRAVIFKNNTFFTNIEGKNVKLIAAPHKIFQFEDIEILLSLVDEFSLKNQFVEQAPYIP